MTTLPPPDAVHDALRAALAGVSGDAVVTPDDGRVGAVLVLFASGRDGVEVVLTRRRRDMRSHPGQVSFPGGRVEPGDRDLEATALREAREETGLDPDTVDVLGAGRTFYLPPSRFWVAPVVAWWRRPHDLVPEPAEVDEVLRVPLSVLVDPARWRSVPLSAGGATWAWQLDHDLLWGATAIVLSQLLRDVLGDWSDGVEPDDLDETRVVRPWQDAPAWTPRTRLPSLPGVAASALAPVGRDGVASVVAALGPAGRAAVAERAAAAVVTVAAGLLDGLEGRRVTVMVGPGGTGTVGLRAATRLRAAGAEVVVRPSTHRPDLADQPVGAVLDPPADVAADVRLDRHVGAQQLAAVPDADRAAGELVVDALLGPGATPPLRGGPALLALWAARTDVPVVAVGLPSGVSADEGLLGPSAHADVTIALGMPTRGLFERIVAPYAGEVVVADVGIDAAVWEQAEVEVPSTLFDAGPLVRVERDAVASDAGTPDQGPPTA